MKKRYLMNAIAVAAMVLASVIGLGCERDVRQPAVAGAFYPADPKILDEAVTGYLKSARKTDTEGRLVALIVPHAGYRYSAGVAAYSYKQVEGADYDTVIILGPSHKYSMKGASVWAGDAVKTPLGEIPVDRRIAETLINPKDNVVYEPLAHKEEHSVEVQFPFIQKVLPHAKVVPVVIASPDPAAMDRLAGKIAELLTDRDRKVLLVISTDLSHYKDYKTCNEMDAKTIGAIRDLSDFELKLRTRMGQAECCGYYPVLVGLDVARRISADRVYLFKHANSGDATGQMDRVVGYAAMGIYRTGEKPDAGLTDSQKRRLVDIAKETVASYTKTGDKPEFEVDDPALKSTNGAFVTLKEDGRLRGCIGRFFSDGPLYETVMDMAVNAAANDRRFRPVAPEELGRIKVEVSVLSPLRKADSPDEIQVGKHGIYIIKGNHAGVLLPQVAVENGWDRETFLRQTCRKAGLGPDDWKEGADIYLFTAQVFGEDDPFYRNRD